MSKHIIDFPDGVEWGVVTCRTEDGFYTRDFDSLEELNSDYINEHYGDLQDTAYQQGLEDAWECARKIVLSPDEGGTSLVDLFAIFGSGSMEQVFRKCSASQVIEKLKAYEQKQNDKIEVGDEVEPFYTNITGVVTLIDGDTIYILWRDGSSTSAMKLKEVTKTGRHFDIASILEEMRND